MNFCAIMFRFFCPFPVRHFQPHPSLVACPVKVEQLHHDDKRTYYIFLSLACIIRCYFVRKMIDSVTVLALSLPWQFVTFAILATNQQ